MTEAYSFLSSWYDRLTEDVNYSVFADYYTEKFSHYGGEFKLLLDLCCGTGSLTCEMTKRGYELISVDSSPEMLIQAQSKAADLTPSPLFICQAAEELDLYGTVDAAYSSLDSINYIPRSSLDSVFKRLSLFIRPGGLFIFDIRTPQWMKEIDGYVSVDEDDDVFCVWRADFDEDSSSLLYGMDLFSKSGKLWKREKEEHIEYAYTEEELRSLLEINGFSLICAEDYAKAAGTGRLFFTAVRK